MAEIFDVVKHKNGWIGVVRSVYYQVDTPVKMNKDGTVTKHRVLDVEVDNEFRDMVYKSPESNWTVIAPNEEGPLTYITKGDK